MKNFDEFGCKSGLVKVLKMAIVEPFDKQEANKIVYEAIAKVLGQEKVFKTEKMKKWNDAIMKQVLEELAKLQKAFKYVVTCFINQRDGAGIFTHTSCWYSGSDSSEVFRWENEALFCVVMISFISID